MAAAALAVMKDIVKVQNCATAPIAEPGGVARSLGIGCDLRRLGIGSKYPGAIIFALVFRL